jgi:potassium intermediate/small conductance calcium-activated channel subfamily N protein 2
MAMWNCLITMTTIGYGDYYPISHCGRFVAILTAFWGVLDTSLFVVALMSITKFSDSEQKAYRLLERLQLKDDLKLEAVNMLK